MSKRSRSFLVVSLLPALALACMFAVANADDAKAPLAKATKWSDKATWPNKMVPVAGAKVEIPTGKEVILDVSPPALNGITVMGKLSFADKSDLELTTEWIMVHGELEVGTEARPFTHKATVTLITSKTNS
jgi:cell migration-inducing and hyaluronan-binding protein